MPLESNFICAFSFKIYTIMIKEVKHIDSKRLARKGKSVTATIRQQESSFKAGAENYTLYYNCANDWNALRETRDERRRNLRYKNGDQWGDIITDPDTKQPIREDAYITKNGKVPLKHNFIQQYVRNIHGQFLSNPSQTVVHARSKDETDLSEMLTNTVQASHQLNDVQTLDLNILEEIIAGGIGVGKIGYKFWSEKNKYDATIDLVNTNRVFFNQDFEDPRMTDVRRIGEIHDYTWDDLIRNFARNRRDVETLSGKYAAWRKDMIEVTQRSRDKLETLDFFGLAASENKYRVIEVWEKVGRWVVYCHDYLDGTEEIHTDLTMAEVRRMNDERIALGRSQGLDPDEIKLIYAEETYEYYWRVKFLGPNGLCLKEMETPYRHESHPYIFCAMPLVDGRILPVMSDLIDIQRYINRLITMIDFIMASSAKGLLMVPEDAIPESWSLDDFKAEYIKTNGVILIKKGYKGELPEQVANNATNIGAWEMLQLQMDMMSRISGLSGAVQGQTARAGTASSLYAQEAQNSMLNYTIVFDRMSNYQKGRDEKLLKVIMQYYDEKRYVDVNGDAYMDAAKFYEPELARKVVDFNLTTSQSMNTPVFRQMADEMLMKLLETNRIPLNVFLDNASIPGAAKLKSDLEAFEQQAAGGGVDPALMEGLVGQAGQNADPRAMAMLGQFLNSDAPIEGAVA